MGMPVIVEIRDEEVRPELFDEVFAYFVAIDEKFSTYKETSEISAINRREVTPADYSDEMKEVFALAEETKRLSNGYFDIMTPGGTIDPSGLVKGWAIAGAAELLRTAGVENFYVEAGGDIEVSGRSAAGKPWRIGIENPLIPPGSGTPEVIKTVHLTRGGIATSGTNKRGAHIYDPLALRAPEDGVASLTVLGPNVYEADRFATAAFAMGRKGIEFIEQMEGLEGYQVGKDGIAVMTSGFLAYTREAHA